MERGVAFRSRLVSAGGCCFQAKITVDYGLEVQNFTLDCDTDSEGNVSFSVVEPDTIAGISGQMQGQEGTLSYDGLQLAFPLLVYGKLSPVSAPAHLVKCWLNEYILSAGLTHDGYRISFEKKINEKDLLIDTYFEKDIPISAEVCYNGYRIIDIKITEFSFH